MSSLSTPFILIKSKIIRRASALLLTILVVASVATAQTTPTTITVPATVKHAGVKRFGMNLGGQTYWDSGQIMKNLTFRNPGFEGETWQSILHCAAVTATTCTDDNIYTVWPANFLEGATATFIYGAANGETATISASTVASSSNAVGVTVTFSAMTTAPAVGDYLVVRMSIPGNAAAGWWTTTAGGATLTTDTTDLSSETLGKQALAINASGSGQSAAINSYFDTTVGRSFLQLNGNYTLTFRAKGVGGNNGLCVIVQRVGVAKFLSQMITLTNSWQDYSMSFSAAEVGQVGSLGLSFSVTGGSVYLDDVALTPVSSSTTNPTAFRDQVVSTIESLNPGILRYMDSGDDFGSSLQNMLAPAFARLRPGYSNYNSESDDIPIGLHEFLVLCQTVGAEPWYTMQAGMSTQEMSNLMDYLGGSTSTTYGALRASLGQTAPWTSVFSKIHLEFGNEVWNTANPGANMVNATAYGSRAATIFATARASASYSPSVIDLVMDGWEANPTWSKTALAASSGYDTIDAAPYLFGSFNDASSNESIYGPMFAEPELIDSTSTGTMQQQAAIAAAANAKLAVYESNLSTNSGSATQAQINSVVPSLGAGLASVDHMLLMLRDDGIINQNMFQLSEYNVPFSNSAISGETTPLWGTVVDMGNLEVQRPTFLALQLANSAMLSNLLATTQSGANPTWAQATSSNDNVSLAAAHYIQSFGFSNGTTNKLVLFNLNRTTALPVVFTGTESPYGSGTVQTLTSTNITDNNEAGAVVAATTASQTFTAGETYTLPAYSMTVITTAAPTITAVTDSCPVALVDTGAATTCTASVTGTGLYPSTVTWSVDLGTITSAGVYTAPASLATATIAHITATSTLDSTKSATYAINVPASTSAVTGIAVTCAPTALVAGASSNCVVTVTGIGSYSSSVSWTTTAGTITAAGLLTAPSNVASLTVTATSQQTPTITGSVTIPVTIVPAISAVTVSGLTSSSATISWTSSFATSNGLSYGTTTKYGSTTAYSATTSTAPSYTLTGLTPATTYDIMVWSENSVTKVVSTQTLSFTTAPSSASAVTSVTVTCASSAISQSATTACAASVAGTGSYSSLVTWSTSAGTITQTGVLTAPASNTTVTVTATSQQKTSLSGSATVAVSNSPVISGITSSLTATSATISWTSSLATRNGISYGTTTKYGSSTAYVATTTTSPSFTLTGLTPSTTYDLMIWSENVTTGVVTSQLTTITTPALVTGVAVACSPTAVYAGLSSACAATVTGVGKFSTAVTWSTSAGTITSAGVLTAPMNVASVTVTATSQQTAGVAGTSTIAITLGPSITGITVSGLTATTATISWTSSFASRNGISYGTTKSYGSTTPSVTTLTASPSFTLTGLTTKTTYYLMVWSKNATNGAITDVLTSFTTP
jgi:alpha-L-arabinofuranosidase